MRTQQLHYKNNDWADVFVHPAFNADNAQLVFAFGAPDVIVKPAIYTYLRSHFTNASIVFSSTSGEILDDAVFDDTVVVTAIEFDKATIRCAETEVNKHADSFETGKLLMDKLDQTGLKSVFVISDGTFINGSELVAGLNDTNPYNVPVSGGLAGDSDRFNSTFTGLNKVPTQGNVIAIGFYGDDLQVKHGTCGGWDEFGPERTITKADKNVLYEIDGKNALDLYKQYLGNYANELPGSALLFPLSLRVNNGSNNLVRTILSIDEQAGTMTFAGNLPEGSKVRLMKANFDKLIKAASAAAENANEQPVVDSSALAILVSCVGRKLVLNDLTDEELIAAKQVLGSNTIITGFYSYGEISPSSKNTQCELHNQTMTITILSEL